MLGLVASALFLACGGSGSKEDEQADSGPDAGEEDAGAEDSGAETPGGSLGWQEPFITGVMIPDGWELIPCPEGYNFWDLVVSSDGSVYLPSWEEFGPGEVLWRFRDGEWEEVESRALSEINFRYPEIRSDQIEATSDGRIFLANDDAAVVMVEDGAWSIERSPTWWYGTWVLEDGRALLVGYYRAAVLDEGVLSDLTSPWMASVYAPWGCDAETVLAINYDGEDYSLISFDGAGWNTVDEELPGAVYGLWGTACDDFYAVGESIWRFDGESWMEQDYDFPSDYFWDWEFHDVWGSGPDDVYVVGTVMHEEFEADEDIGFTSPLATVMHWDGTMWNELFYHWSWDLDFNEESLGAVWGSGADDIYMLGDHFYHYGGDPYVEVSDMGANPYISMWGLASDDIYAFDHDYNLGHFDGTAWNSEADFGDTFGIVIRGNAIGMKVVFGVYGSLSWSEGEEDWTTLIESRCCSLRDLVAAGGDVYATCNYGDMVVRYDGESWQDIDIPQFEPDNMIGALWAAEDGELLVGANQSISWPYASPRLLRFEGVSWEEVDLPDEVAASFDFKDIISFGTGEIVLVGRRQDAVHEYVGMVLIHDDAGWQVHEPFPGGLASAVWGLSPDELYAIASTGEVAQWDGSTWKVWGNDFMQLRQVDGDTQVGVYITLNDYVEGKRFLLRKLFD